jgi:hypothetical protein
MSSVAPNAEETYKVEPLQGSANYRTWKFSMRMVLQARDLWEVVSGEEVDPEAKIGGSALLSKTRKAEGDCHYCGQQGHWKRDCPVRKYREGKGHERGEHESGNRKRAMYSM